MRKLSMERSGKMTFAEGCKSYLDNCKQRNLREGTIKHYRQRFDQFFWYFDLDMLLILFMKEKHNEYILYLREMLSNDIGINVYLSPVSGGF